MFGDANLVTFLVLLAVAVGGITSVVRFGMDYDYRKQLRGTLESLRDNLNQAKGLVEQNPQCKEAKATYDRALLLYTLVENGLETRRNAYAILRAIASEVGTEMAISARFQAGARK